jgi:protein phosphatase
VKIAAHARTDVGRWRPANEDAHIVLDRLRVFAVADGMGGHAAGEVASRIAVDVIASLAQSADDDPTALEQRLTRAVDQANDAIAQAAESTPEHAGMGTTLTVLAFTDDGSAGAFAHVGDSRLYRFRDRQLVQLTHDHTWVQEQVSQGNLTVEQARSHPLSSMLSRALGTQEDIEIERGPVQPAAGDVYLLCSDGLTNMLTDTMISEILGNYDAPRSAAEQLVERANQQGGRDNITALVVRVDA